MNFLAHLYLSGDDEKIMVGNFIGDFVKGRDLASRFEQDIVVGIELHRAIDEFTDRHPIVKKSKERLRPKYRHYAPVIVDVFYDHFLARNWSTFHPLPLADYAANAYRMLQKKNTILPQEVNWMLPYMIKGNWLVNYAAVEGIRQALSGMARRTKFVSHMEEAATDLDTHYQDFLDEFSSFLPLLKAFSDEFIAAKKTSL